MSHATIRDGDLAELRFMQEALAHGFEVAKPFGNQAGFDVVLHAKGRLFRVQVKSISGRTYSRHRRVPKVNLQGRNVYRSTKKTGIATGYDILAVLNRAEDQWVFLTFRQVGGRQSVALSPALARDDWKVFARLAR